MSLRDMKFEATILKEKFTPKITMQKQCCLTNLKGFKTAVTYYGFKAHSFIYQQIFTNQFVMCSPTRPNQNHYVMKHWMFMQITVKDIASCLSSTYLSFLLLEFDFVQESTCLFRNLKAKGHLNQFWLMRCIKKSTG